MCALLIAKAPTQETQALAIDEGDTVRSRSTGFFCSLQGLEAEATGRSRP